MLYLGNYNIGDPITVRVSTYDPTTGQLANASGNVSYTVVDGDTVVTSGTFVHEGLDGLYKLNLTVSDSFVNGKEYNLLVFATVGGVQGRKEFMFQVGHSPLVENGYTLVQTLRAMLAFMLGLNTSEATTSGQKRLTFRDVNDTMDRVTMEVDSKSNRLTITIDTDDAP